MSSLMLISGYGSGSDSDDNAGGATTTALVDATSGTQPNNQGIKKNKLPSAVDMFSSGFIAASMPTPATSVAPKRSAEYAFGQDPSVDNIKSSYIRLNDKPHAADKKPTIKNMFKPPQLRRPNTVTEDSNLWNSSQMKQKQQQVGGMEDK